MPRDRRLVELRLIAQRLASPSASTPQEAAAQLGASQGQHFGGVVASIAQRTIDGTWRGVIDAMNRGEIVRGYPMRGTVFAVSADDLAWQTSLTAQRQLDGAKRRRIDHGLDELIDLAADVARQTIAEQPEQPEQPDRAARRAVVTEAWEAAGIPTDAGRSYHLGYTLMVRGDIAYGPVEGSEQLFVDAHEWLPESGTLDGRFNGDVQAATEHWLHRYLTSHGPATLRDFAWWTKLPLGQIRRAAPAATAELEAYGELDGETLWGRAGLEDERARIGSRSLARARLLAPFDEMVLGYADRTYIVEAAHHPKLVPGNNGVFKNGALRGGKIVGTWSSKERSKSRALVLAPFAGELASPATTEFERAFARYPHPER